jgi:hypothetical protein
MRHGIDIDDEEFRALIHDAIQHRQREKGESERNQQGVDEIREIAVLDKLRIRRDDFFWGSTGGTY